MNVALILSGGIGKRLGSSIPKQYIEVDGKMVISYCLSCFLNCSQIDKIQIVADVAWQEQIQKEMGNKFAGFSRPGANRQLSILNGLKDILKYADEQDAVMIHDAARPLVSEKLIVDCFKALDRHEGVVPALPMKDTVYYGINGKIESLLDRSKIIAGQAPEVFRLGAYYRANLSLLPDKILQINGSAEPAILADMDICYIAGDENNFKITSKEDLERFQQIITCSTN